MIRTILKKASYFIPAAILMLVAIPAHAAIIVNQTNSDASSTQTGNSGNDFLQQLGTGLSGTIGSISWIMSIGGGGSVNPDANLELKCYTDPFYTLPCTDMSNDYKTSELVTQPTPHTFTATLLSGHTAFTFNSSDYYVLFIQTNSSNISQPITFYGGAGTFPQVTSDFSNPSGSGMTNAYFWIDTGNPFVNDCTGGSIGNCIDTVSPANNTTIATATAYVEGSTGYVSSTSAPNGATLNMTVKNNSAQIQGFFNGLVQNTVCFFTSSIGNNQDINPACGNIGVPISSGAYSFSTTTPAIILNGTYTLTTSITTPDFSFLGINIGQNTLVSTTTTFLGAATTTYDSISDAQLSGIQALAGGQSFSQDNCNVGSGSFSISLCIDYLIIPTQANFSQDIANLQSGFLTRMPWGYANRIVQIMTSDPTAAALPETTVPIYIGSSTTPAEELVIDPQDTIVGGAAYLNSFHAYGSGLTLRQIVEPYIDLFIGISLMIIVFHDLMAMGTASKGRGHGEGSGKGNRNSEKYREWLYTHK